MGFTRRDVLASGVAAALTSMFGCAAPSRTAMPATFRSVPLSRADTLVVPEGYRADVLFAWGDPVGAQAGAPAFRFDASNSAADQALQAGMHHDGMEYYPLPYGSTDSSHGLLAMNHEYHSDGLLFPDGAANWNAQKVAKAIAASGVSVIEVEKAGTGWRVVRPSRYARRITADTPCTISGPAAGSDLMKTARDPSGREALGTFAGCAHGWTPWGTYLTAEENFQERFVNAGVQSDLQKRDLIPAKSRANWEVGDERFDAAKHPNEPNRFGWIVEIDPYEPTSKPVKRTAIGRCCHEGATPSLAPDGRLAIYTGDDKAFEYVYKFVSRDKVDMRNRAANGSVLDNGILYVAKFNADGSGEWLPLVHGQRGLTADRGFRDQGEVLVKTRMAADVVGGTKMDRPEWIAVNERTREVVATLTFNADRGASGRPGPDAVNPRANNLAGHIVRWRESNDDPTSLVFRWDILALAGDPAATNPGLRGSFTGDAFANPDGVRFDPSGRLWVMTDISPTRLNKGDFERFGNNQLLVVDPATGAFHRFLTGPVGCEVTGLVFTPDGRTAFLNIQHPGEIGGESNDPRNPHAHSNWPDFRADGRPRSGTVVIQRIDGNAI
jgi:secreted PhoX family phosphatase